MQLNTRKNFDQNDNIQDVRSPKRVSTSPSTVQLNPALPPRAVGPVKPHPTLDCIDHQENQLIEAVKNLLSISSPLEKPELRFDISQEAAKNNFRLLKGNNFNLHKILNPPNKTSVTTYGSEFKSVNELQQLFCLHPRWPEMKKLLKNGSLWPIKPLTDSLSKKDLSHALARGNHKSTGVQNSFFSDALSKEIKKGWELIKSKEDGMKIPGIVISPMGVAEQIGISATGEFVPKLRLTHDLSFPGKESGESINSRVEKINLNHVCSVTHYFA